jgi:hypothetical protein
MTRGVHLLAFHACAYQHEVLVRDHYHIFTMEASTIVDGPAVHLRQPPEVAIALIG